MASNFPPPPVPPPPVPPAGHRPPPPAGHRPPPPAGVRPPAPPPVREPKVSENHEPEDRFDIEDDYTPGPYDDNMAASFGLPPVFIKTKVLVPLFCLMILIGAGLGFFIEKTAKSGETELPGVVNNPEIPKGRPRCGRARKGQGCVIYIMNPSNQEMMAKDFFEIAASFLKVPKFQIETANIQYATTRIPPGYIALFNIPPVQ